MTYLRYVITEITQARQQPDTSVPTQKADKSNTQELPVAQEKASDVIQNTGPQGEGLYDSATGERLLSTEQQIIDQGQVGDRVTPALAAELQSFASGN
jgi:hypothetical protein|tara:strand:- start:544 stop:837 length:294 start_codon:yes stop_codon:yes gene_type:complete